MTDNDIRLDDSSRPTLLLEPYDGKGSRGGGNHVMSGEPLFKCPKYGLTATSYCYSCSNFNGLKKDKRGDMGECDLYPGVRNRIVAQVAREQPPEVTGQLSKNDLSKMGVRNLNDGIEGIGQEPSKSDFGGLNPRSVASINPNQINQKFNKKIEARTIGAVENDFKKSKKKMDGW